MLLFGVGVPLHKHFTKAPLFLSVLSAVALLGVSLPCDAAMAQDARLQYERPRGLIPLLNSYFRSNPRPNQAQRQFRPVTPTFQVASLQPLVITRGPRPLLQRDAPGVIEVPTPVRARVWDQTSRCASTSALSARAIPDCIIAASRSPTPPRANASRGYALQT